MTDIARERALLTAQGLEIITRNQFGARQSYASARTVDEPAKWFFLHITVTPDPADTSAAEIAAWLDVEAIGQSRFGIGFSYNAGAMQSGRLYEGQPLTRRGAHTVNDKDVPGFPSGSLNYGGRAVALCQNVADEVTDAQIHAIARWAAAQRRSGLALPNAPWYGHRDFAFKSCPGDKGYARLNEIRSLTNHYTTHGLGDDDMPTAAEVAAAVWSHKFPDGQPAWKHLETIETAVTTGAQDHAEWAAADRRALRDTIVNAVGQVTTDVNAQAQSHANWARDHRVDQADRVIEALSPPVEPPPSE